MKKLVVLMMAALLLSSCTLRYASNGENKYLQSRNGAGLVVPPPLSSANINHFYDLPEQNQNAVVSIIPPTA